MKKLVSELKQQSCMEEVHSGVGGPHLRRSLHISQNSIMAGTEITI